MKITKKEILCEMATISDVSYIKNNSKYIREYNLTDYDGILDTMEFLLYKKVKVNHENKWLYFYLAIS